MDVFKLIVAGSRDYTDTAVIEKEILWMANELLHDRSVIVVSGMARGPDRIAYDFCVREGYEVEGYPADWKKYGRRAGMIRNTEMAKVADGLLAFHINNSRGTAHMIETMLKQGKPVRIITP